MPDQTHDDARQILDAAPYDAGDAPTTSRPLPVRDDVLRVTQERDHLAGLLARIGDTISPTGERPEEALGTLVADVEALVEQRDRYAEALDLIGCAVAGGTDDTLRPGIESMIRNARPEAMNLWEPVLARRRAAALGSPLSRAQDADLAPWIRRAIANPGSIAGPRRGPTWPTNHEGHNPEQETVTDWQTRAVLRILAVDGRPHCELCDQQIAVDDSYDPPLTGVGLWQHAGPCPVREG
ncbi:hypothetical protein ACQSSU_12750 [Micromonospora echinospora]